MGASFKQEAVEASADAHEGRWLTIPSFLAEQGVPATGTNLERIYTVVMQWAAENGLRPFVGEETRTMNAFPERELMRILAWTTPT